MIKVCKFGGSSVKDAFQIKKTVDIINSDEKRKVIVVSAPGIWCGDKRNRFFYRFPMVM